MGKATIQVSLLKGNFIYGYGLDMGYLSNPLVVSTNRINSRR